MNWFNGKYYEEIEPSLFLPEKVTCMEMNSEFIVVGQADGKIVLHSRFEPLVKGITSY